MQRVDVGELADQIKPKTLKTIANSHAPAMHELSKTSYSAKSISFTSEVCAAGAGPVVPRPSPRPSFVDQELHFAKQQVN